MSHRDKPVVALDIGGTKIIASVISPGGKMMSRVRCLTYGHLGPDKVIARMTGAITRALNSACIAMRDTAGLSIAAAAIIDSKRGLITTAPNLPGWVNIPLRDILSEKLGTAVFLLNDASAAALGEHRLGAGKDVDNLIYITVSTGIGGGMIVNGQLYEGTDGCAAEIGHMVIKVGGPLCKCGKQGCYEAMASGTAITRMARERLKCGEDTVLLQLSGNAIDKVCAATVARAYRKNDVVARSIIDEAAYYLGVGLANLVNLMNPQMIIIGGGVSKMGEILLKPARKAMKENAFKLPASTVRIVRAGLGTDTGMIGAAIYANEQGVKWE